MAEDLEEDFDDDARGEGDGGPPARSGGSGGGRKMLLLVVLPVIVLLGAGAGIYFTGIATPLLSESATGEDMDGPDVVLGDPVYMELEEMIVNLNSSGRRQRFLKLQLRLELPSEEAMAAVERVRPRVADTVQEFLRDLRPEELEGSSGTYRLREEVIYRVNKLLPEEYHVSMVLFDQILIQ